MKDLGAERTRRSLYLRVRDYQVYIPIHFETEDFLVTTAQNGRELLKALELRHQVFIQEWQGRRHPTGLDVDKYDFMADHLLIIDKRKQEVVGTYRMLYSRFTKEILSPLLRSYFHAGAKIFGAPALDCDFDCVDLRQSQQLHLLTGNEVGL